MKYITKHPKTLCYMCIILQCIAINSVAQEMHMAGMEGMAGMKESKNVFISIMDTMMLKMNKVAKGQSSSTTFIKQMIPHHEGAIAMADYEISYGQNFEMIQLAKSIKAEQQSELLQMQLLLKQIDPDEKKWKSLDKEMDISMEKMMNNMPAEKSLKDTDHAFARIMLTHHQAAIDMARVLLKYPENVQVSAFVKQLISNEQIEIEQMSTYLSAYQTNAQSPYTHDRVYAANQVSNTVSVVNPANNTFLGEINLGKPYPNVLSPLYRGQSLVHGLRYSPQKKMLAVVSIGSNSVTLVSTETNKVIKTIYVGRSPHEPTFTPDSKQIWVSVRGEAYVSVIDVATMKEVRKIEVADGPGMISFSPDGKIAYVCSSFTPELDIVNTANYQIVKRIPVVSPFSPNIFTSPNGEWVAMTHKDVGKVTMIDTRTLSVHKVLTTGAITNHVTFAKVSGKLKMLVTVGGENKVRVFDVATDFKQTDTINVGNLPHGLWPSADGKLMYVGLEYGDQVQGIDLQRMIALPAVKIGQSPQALVYADHAVTDPSNRLNLTPLNDSTATQIIQMHTVQPDLHSTGKIAVRPIGLADLVEQIFTGLEPQEAYTLILSKADIAPYSKDYEINSFDADAKGKYMGQSTGLIKTTGTYEQGQDYKHIVLINTKTGKAILVGGVQTATN